jgi:cytochrome c
MEKSETSMRRALVLCAVALSTSAVAAEAPSLGRVATPEEIARVDISIAPDGRNLPPGSGSVAQGANVYAAKCLACHGEAGAGGPMDRLTGGIGTLTSARPVKTVASYWPYATTVFDYVRRAMPTSAPQSLTNDEVYAVIAYILSIDGIVPKDAVMDARTLPLVRMPNRDGFVDWSGNLAR